MLKPKEIKYRVTGAFGLYGEGVVINALLITQDEDSGFGLIYHPRACGECPSFEIGKPDPEASRKSNTWVSITPQDVIFPDQYYVNVGGNSKKFEAEFLGKNFKFKREFQE